MKFFTKEVDGKSVTLQCDNENHFSLFEREGFIETDKKGNPVKVEEKTEE